MNRRILRRTALGVGTAFAASALLFGTLRHKEPNPAEVAHLEKALAMANISDTNGWARYYASHGMGQAHFADAKLMNRLGRIAKIYYPEMQSGKGIERVIETLKKNLADKEFLPQRESMIKEGEARLSGLKSKLETEISERDKEQARAIAKMNEVGKKIGELRVVLPKDSYVINGLEKEHSKLRDEFDMANVSRGRRIKTIEGAIASETKKLEHTYREILTIKLLGIESTK